MSNIGSCWSSCWIQTSLSLEVEQGLQKLPKFDINDLRLLFHGNILIPWKCLRSKQWGWGVRPCFSRPCFAWQDRPVSCMCSGLCLISFPLFYHGQEKAHSGITFLYCSPSFFPFWSWSTICLFEAKSYFRMTPFFCRNLASLDSFLLHVTVRCSPDGFT